MTYNEETYILNTIKRIRDQTNENNKILKENNIMLRKLYNCVTQIIARANQENIDDFTRNILANLISNKIDLFKLK